MLKTSNVSIKKTFGNLAATLGLLLALLAAFSSDSYSQNPQCNGLTGSRTIDVYGTVTAAGGAAVFNMPVQAYSNAFGSVLIATAYTDQFGIYHLYLDCGRPWAITVDTKHPNGDFGQSPDVAPVNKVVQFDEDDAPLFNAGNFNIPSCTLPGNTVIAGGTYERQQGSGTSSPVSGVTVIALNPKDNSLQSYGVSSQPSPGGIYNYNVAGLFPCSTYRVIAYFDPAVYLYVEPGESLSNTGFSENSVIGGVSVNGWDSLGNFFIATLR